MERPSTAATQIEMQDGYKGGKSGVALTFSVNEMKRSVSMSEGAGRCEA